MNVYTLEAGRELDALIADKVMHQLRWSAPGRAFFHQSLAIEIFPGGVHPKLQRYPDGSPRWEKGNGDRWFSAAIPHYSADISAAWQILDHLASEQCNVQLTNVTFCTWTCDLVQGARFSCQQAATAPLAICRAALELIESERHQ